MSGTEAGATVRETPKTGWLAGLANSVKDTATDAATGAKTVAKGAVVNNLPGAGVLFTYDADGLRLKPVAQLGLAGLAAYGVVRMLGR